MIERQIANRISREIKDPDSLRGYDIRAYEEEYGLTKA